MSSQNKDVESGSQGGQLLPFYPGVRTPGGTAHVVSDPSLLEVTPVAGIRQLQPAVTPASPVEGPKRAGSSKGKPGPTKKSRRSRHARNNSNIFYDSGSDDGDEDYDFDSSEDDTGIYKWTENNVRRIRKFTRLLRYRIIAEDEGEN